MVVTTIKRQILRLNAMFRKAIKEELKRQGQSKYWLAQQLELTTANTIYRYLRGDLNLSGHRIAEMLQVLKIELNPTAKVSKPAKKKKR